MHTAYQNESYKLKIKNVTLTVTNIVPVVRDDEKVLLKKDIEQNLYDVFNKYENPHPCEE